MFLEIVASNIRLGWELNHEAQSSGKWLHLPNKTYRFYPLMEGNMFMIILDSNIDYLFYNFNHTKQS